MNRFQSVADHQRRSGVKRLRTILSVARSRLCYWHRTEAARAARQTDDAKLAARIHAVHRDPDRTRGIPRITAEPRDTGKAANHKKIARITRRVAPAGLRLRRKHRTAISDPAAAKTADLIGRDFTAATVNTKYAGDITSPPLPGGKFLYPPTAIDPAPRRLAGWTIAGHIRAGLVTDTPAAAERCHGSLSGAVLHTDHSAQYTSRALTDACRRADVIQNMTAAGSSADNTLAESSHTTCKQDTLQARRT